MDFLVRRWQRRGLLPALLWPVAQLYGFIIGFRRHWYASRYRQTVALDVPIIVVGNLSVGGTGKTPVCAILVDRLKTAGWRPAIVSRGYGGKETDTPRLVRNDDSAEDVGDEPLMLARTTKVPVCVCVNRRAAVSHVIACESVDIVVSDDGLQHLAMPRDAQIIVVDGQRGFGNGWLLPAGPLRDYPGTINPSDILLVQTRHADDTQMHKSLHEWMVTSGRSDAMKTCFHLELLDAVSLLTNQTTLLDHFREQTVHAVAGTGNPTRFFDSLRRRGIIIEEHPMPDHHKFVSRDLQFEDELPVFVTSKDAVKIRSLESLSDQDKAKVYEIPAKAVASQATQDALQGLVSAMNQYRH